MKWAAHFWGGTVETFFHQIVKSPFFWKLWNWCAIFLKIVKLISREFLKIVKGIHRENVKLWNKVFVNFIILWKSFIFMHFFTIMYEMEYISKHRIN